MNEMHALAEVMASLSAFQLRYHQHSNN